MTVNLGVFRRTVGIFLVVIFLVGCSSKLPPTAPSGESLIQVTIDWSKLSGYIQEASITATPNEANTIGARLIYPKENAAFTQAISKGNAQTQSVLTLEVPATNQAHLYLVAVNSETQTAFSFALAENLRLEAHAILPMTTDDFQWVEATWVIEESYVNSVNNKHFEFPCNEKEVMVNIEVRDPFQEGKQASYETSFIGHNGISSMCDNVNGWLGFEAFFRNPTPGVPNTGRHWMQPNVDGSQFNLGNKGYYIPPVIRDVLVDWK